ncbi:MAG TPA: DNA recombination protein RmuC [Verrucomicrobiota bacterium]|nr:DNA recombination protein RmuC [Verrucomicrobiota bacterium]
MLWVDRIVLLGLGLLAGFWLGWLLRATRRSGLDPRLEQELRGQLAVRESELAHLRASAAEANALRAVAESKQAAAEAQSGERATGLATAEQRVAQAQAEARQLATALASAKAEVETGRALLDQQRRVQADHERQLRERHDAALAGLRDQFKAIAADALAANGPEFLRLANESFARFKASAEGDLAQRQISIESLVKPLEEQLRVYQQRLQQAEAQQQSTLGQVKQHLESLASQSQTLSNETQRLRVVLSSGQARGRWGEATLRRVVEAAQLSAHCDFTEQMTVGDSQPDLVVHLPGDRVIIVDSKVPDLEFLDALGTADPTQRADALAAHARKLKDTIRSLADRDYPKHFAHALDYVVLFLPAESLFSAALEGDRDLIIWAAQHRILLATPASLIALLRSVAISWQQQEQSQNARQIADAAQQLYERVTKFAEHFETIREGLQKANRAYDAAVGSYERSVRPSGERLRELGGVQADGGLSEIPLLQADLRFPPGLGDKSS